MKKSELRQIIREEIKRTLKEYGSESLYYSNPSSYEQIKQVPVPRMQRYDNHEKWKVTAMQLGATIKDRGDDWLAVMPNQDVLGTFDKMMKIGELYIYS